MEKNETDPITLLTLSKLDQLFKKMEYASARQAIKVGYYEVDLTVRIKGRISVAPGTMRAPTASIPVKELIAHFIHYAGVTREVAMESLEKALVASLNTTGKGEGALEHAGLIKDVYKKTVDEFLAKLPDVPVEGPIDVKQLTFEILNDKE